MKDSTFLSDLCRGAHAICQQAIENADHLEIRPVDIDGSTVLDFAVKREGTTEAGIMLAEICLGGRGEVEVANTGGILELPTVRVNIARPLEVCIGAQYAGWPLSHEKYFAMCSGPIRMLRGKEPILLVYDLRVDGGKAIGVLESNELPAPEVVRMVAEECGVGTSDVVLCIARTASLPGSIQIVARSIETTLHKLHELEFDLKTIVGASGQAPLPPLAKDDMTALGWTNDAILYGATVHLEIDAADEAILNVLEQIPSCSSAEFGTPFLEIFRRYEHDFYKIDKMLFSPARVTITNQKTGCIFEVGETRPDVLRQSFGME